MLRCKTQEIKHYAHFYLACVSFPGIKIGVDWPLNVQESSRVPRNSLRTKDHNLLAGLKTVSYNSDSVARPFTSPFLLYERIYFPLKLPIRLSHPLSLICCETDALPKDSMNQHFSILLLDSPYALQSHFTWLYLRDRFYYLLRIELDFFSLYVRFLRPCLRGTVSMTFT